jgi:hypothetical protein
MSWHIVDVIAVIGLVVACIAAVVGIVFDAE